MVQQQRGGTTMSNAITRVEDMPVFQLFFAVAVEIEAITRGFPADFRWLRTQLLRSSESVAANMTEGFYSQYSSEYLQALFRCRREARETATHIEYAKAVGLLTAPTVAAILARNEDGLRQLSSLIASVESKMAARGKDKSRSACVAEEREEYADLTREMPDHPANH